MCPCAFRVARGIIVGRTNHSLFWGGVTVGRLLAIPVTAYYDNNALLGGSLIGAVASSTLLLVMGRVR